MAGTPEWAQGGTLDLARPSAALATALETASGPRRRCRGLDDDEVTGVLAGWARTEAWAASGKLATVTELVRRRGMPGAALTGDQVPRAWDDTLTEELAPALGMSRPATVKLIGLAVALATRLDATAAALQAGQVDYLKAKIVAEATAPLDDAAAGNAEKLAMARVETWRETTGTMAIMGTGLNPQQAMEAGQALDTQAKKYKKAGIAGDMDSLRARAMLDKLTGRDPLATARHGLAASVNLVLSVLDLPLLSLLGVADKPGEAAGWGAIDPALARKLAAAAAAAGDRSRWHLTLVDERGRALAHGCEHRTRRTKPGKDLALDGG